MRLLREVLMSKLLRHGITEACGKPVEEASIDELMDEWHRFEVRRNEARTA